MMLLAGAMSGYSQGQVYFYGYNTEGSPPSTLHAAIYDVSAGTYSVTYGGYTVTEQQGDSSTATTPKEDPAATTVYSGAPLGGSSSTGNAYDAQMLAASGSGDPLSLLDPVGLVLHFYTTAANAGFIKGTEVETLGAYGSTYTIAIAVWDNNGVDGAASTLAEAQADGYEWGISNTADDTLTSSATEPPTPMPTTIESFSLGISEVPDQLSSGIALSLISASAFLFRRRK